MMDKNGKELKTGQIVKIEGGYFKSDNGIFLVGNSPNDPNWLGSDYSLRKCNKHGVESKNKYAVAFFPLMVTVSSREKRLLAREHNAKNATIEVIGEVKTYKVKITEVRWYHGKVESSRIVTEAEYNELMFRVESEKNFTVEIIKEL